jgi:hypothetical protein
MRVLREMKGSRFLTQPACFCLSQAEQTPQRMLQRSPRAEGTALPVWLAAVPKACDCLPQGLDARRAPSGRRVGSRSGKSKSQLALPVCSGSSPHGPPRDRRLTVPIAPPARPHSPWLAHSLMHLHTPGPKRASICKPSRMVGVWDPLIPAVCQRWGDELDLWFGASVDIESIMEHYKESLRARP